MKVFISAVLSSTVFALASVQAQAAVILGPFHYNSHIYLLLDQKSWTDSEAEAVSLGGHLATINDAAENTWVTNTFSRDGRHLWIGLTDTLEEGKWRWSSSEAFTFENWGAGEPNNAPHPLLPGIDEDFTHIWGGLDTDGFGPGRHRYFWNDLSNDYFYAGIYSELQPPYGVVEIDSIQAVPEPVSVTYWLIFGLLISAVLGRLKKNTKTEFRLRFL